MTQCIDVPRLSVASHHHQDSFILHTLIHYVFYNIIACTHSVRFPSKLQELGSHQTEVGGFHIQEGSDAGAVAAAAGLALELPTYL